MTAKPLPDINTLLALFEYDADSGVLNWHRDSRKIGRRVPGSKAGYLTERGYIRVEFDGEQYMAHRIVWAIVTGKQPIYEVDHINGDKADNHISNLRDEPKCINQQNKHKARADSKTGFLGVVKYRNRFVAQINRGGRMRHIGVFDTPQDAHFAYLQAKRLYHPGCTI